MTKAEKAAMEKLAEDAALTCPKFARPKPMEIGINQVIEGYSARANGSPQKCWSESHRHGMGAYAEKTYGFGSQGPAILFETAAEAWQEIRWLTCEKYAQELRTLDRYMEEYPNGRL